MWKIKLVIILLILSFIIITRICHSDWLEFADKYECKASETSPYHDEIGYLCNNGIVYWR